MRSLNEADEGIENKLKLMGKIIKHSEAIIRNILTFASLKAQLLLTCDT